MSQDTTVIDSNSIGDPARFHPLVLLEERLRMLPRAPRTVGRVVLLVRRVEGGRRETPDRAFVTPSAGLPGDAWGRAPQPNPDAQLTVMQSEVAELIVNGQPLALFGDNLFFELDLSSANLPLGSRLRAGGVTLEVTPKPHNGCHKFRARFGGDALRFVSMQALRHLNLRGIYMRAIQEGEIAVGDAIEVISRGVSGAPESE
jgi:MOSC domain-containing protein YiiM